MLNYPGDNNFGPSLFRMFFSVFSHLLQVFVEGSLNLLVFADNNEVSHDGHHPPTSHLVPFLTVLYFHTFLLHLMSSFTNRP